MAEFTDRTVFPLGGSVTVDAAASPTANLTLVASGVLARGGGSDLAADTTLTVSVTSTTTATATLSAGSTCISDEGIAIRLGNATMPLAASLEAAAGIVYTDGVEAHLVSESGLEAAGGVDIEATPGGMDANLSMSIATPGRLEDGGTVAMSADTDMDTTVSPVFRLALPTRQHTFTEDRLWRRYPVKTGVTLIVTNGEVVATEYPTDVQLREADDFYLGGYRHQITPAQRAVLISAGYGDLIEEA